jgi:hypothetical protein
MSKGQVLLGQLSLSPESQNLQTTLFDPDGTSWSQTISGLTLQGGTVEVGGGSSLAVNYSNPFGKQVLYCAISAVSTVDNQGLLSGTNSLTGFTITNPGVLKNYHWYAIGV